MLHIAELLYWLRLKREERRKKQISTKEDAESSVFRHDSSLPMYEGFPYLLTRLVPSFYHISLLPEAMNRHDLFDVVANQFEANRLSCCLVFGLKDCCYFSETRAIVPSNDPPRGGYIVSEPPLLPFLPTHSTDFAERASLLKSFELQQEPVGYTIHCEDQTGGGFQATQKQAEILRGISLAGLPRGLAQCPQCGEWRGWCLDPEQEAAELLLRISCRCDNHNLCARCHKPLAIRKLNSNRYNVADGTVWHFPAYLALKHKCHFVERKRPDPKLKEAR